MLDAIEAQHLAQRNAANAARPGTAPQAHHSGGLSASHQAPTHRHWQPQQNVQHCSRPPGAPYAQHAGWPGQHQSTARYPQPFARQGTGYSSQHSSTLQPDHRPPTQEMSPQSWANSSAAPHSIRPPSQRWPPAFQQQQSSGPEQPPPAYSTAAAQQAHQRPAAAHSASAARPAHHGSFAAAPPSVSAARNAFTHGPQHSQGAAAHRPPRTLWEPGGQAHTAADPFAQPNSTLQQARHGNISQEPILAPMHHAAAGAPQHMFVRPLQPVASHARFQRQPRTGPWGQEKSAGAGPSYSSAPAARMSSAHLASSAAAKAQIPSAPAPRPAGSAPCSTGYAGALPSSSSRLQEAAQAEWAGSAGALPRSSVSTPEGAQAGQVDALPSSSARLPEAGQARAVPSSPARPPESAQAVSSPPEAAQTGVMSIAWDDWQPMDDWNPDQDWPMEPVQSPRATSAREEAGAELQDAHEGPEGETGAVEDAEMVEPQLVPCKTATKGMQLDR